MSAEETQDINFSRLLQSGKLEGEMLKKKSILAWKGYIKNQVWMKTLRKGPKKYLQNNRSNSQLLKLKLTTEAIKNDKCSFCSQKKLSLEHLCMECPKFSLERNNLAYDPVQRGS